MNRVALDNDILYKGACYGLLTDLTHALPFPSCSYSVLGAARFMLPKRLEKSPPVAGSEIAIEELTNFLQNAIDLEPETREVELAASLEREALTKGLQLDSGESQLCAIVITRAFRALVTGDKRAIVAIGFILASEPKITGRVYCLEQLFLRLLSLGLGKEARHAVCKNPRVDTALTNCFGCSSPEVPEPNWVEGLNSYVNDLRSTAGGALAEI